MGRCARPHRVPAARRARRALIRRRGGRTLVTRAEAEAEITKAALWYEAQRPGLGEEFLDAVRAAAARALDGPALYQRVHGEMRRILLERFPYALIFRATDNEVAVLGCVHGRRNPEVWRSRA